MCPGITGYGMPKQIHWCRRWNPCFNTKSCPRDAASPPRSPEFPVSHAYGCITVWMSTALCSQTGEAITAVNLLPKRSLWIYIPNSPVKLKAVVLTNPWRDPSAVAWRQ